MITDYFWAKKSSKDGVLKWLPLSQHLDDTTFIIGRLWENWLDDSQRFIVKKFQNIYNSITYKCCYRYLEYDILGRQKLIYFLI